MATLRDWLQLFRSHTSPLEMTITLTGSALAVGTLLDWKVLLFLIFGWLYHNAGYGQNSVEDYIQGYDKDDPNKSHHPLQRGVINPKIGRNVCLIMIGLLVIYGSIISEFNVTAIILLVSLVAMGLVYNLYNKKMKGKFLPIAVAHSLLFPFAYFGSGGDLSVSGSFPFFDSTITQGAMVLWGYLMFQIIYQIMIEGDLKDIDMEEASMLKSMGVNVKDGKLIVSPFPRFVSFWLKAVGIFLLFFTIYILNGSVDTYIIAGIFAIGLLAFDHLLMGVKEWDHSKCLKRMSLMEVLSTFAIAVAIAPEIGGWIPAFGIMAFNMIYFVLMNRFLWGTVIKPKV